MKKLASSQASLFILGQPTDVTVLKEDGFGVQGLYHYNFVTCTVWIDNCNNYWMTIPEETHIAIWALIGALFVLSIIESILEHYYSWMPYKQLYEETGGFITPTYGLDDIELKEVKPRKGSIDSEFSESQASIGLR